MSLPCSLLFFFLPFLVLHQPLLFFVLPLLLLQDAASSLSLSLSPVTRALFSSLSLSLALSLDHPRLRRRRRPRRRRRRRERTLAAAVAASSLLRRGRRGQPPPPPRRARAPCPSSASAFASFSSAAPSPPAPHPQHRLPQRRLGGLRPPYQLQALRLPPRLRLAPLPRVREPPSRDGEGAACQQGAGEPVAVAGQVRAGPGAERGFPGRGGGGGRGRSGAGGLVRRLGAPCRSSCFGSSAAALERVDPRDGGFELLGERRVAGVLRGGGRGGHLREKRRSASFLSIDQTSIFLSEILMRGREKTHYFSHGAIDSLPWKGEKLSLSLFLSLSLSLFKQRQLPRLICSSLLRGTRRCRWRSSGHVWGAAATVATTMATPTTTVHQFSSPRPSPPPAGCSRRRRPGLKKASSSMSSVPLSPGCRC